MTIKLSVAAIIMRLRDLLAKFLIQVLIVMRKETCTVKRPALRSTFNELFRVDALILMSQAFK